MNMDILNTGSLVVTIITIVVLLLAALIMLMIELFLIPGTSIAAIISAGFCIYGIYYAFINLGTLAGVITLSVSIFGGIVAVWRFMRSKTLEKVALNNDVPAIIDRSAAERVKIGDKGTAVTRLALIGNADINGDIIEVKSADGFINPKTPIVVTRISDSVIMVEAETTK